MSRPTELSPELELLKPALEMAIIVARQGESAPVRVEAPRRLRPFLQFSRLPPQALIAARGALDDAAFRHRVAARCDEEEVGRAGWLLLTRPNGWADEVDALVEERVARGEHHAEHTARRDLARAQTTIAEQQARLEALGHELVGVRSELADSMARAADLEGELTVARSAVEASSVERARAVRELKDMEQRLAQRTIEVRELRSSLDAGETGTPTPSAAPAIDVDGLAALVARLSSTWRSAGPTIAELEDVLDSIRDRDRDRDGDGDGGVRPSRRRPLRLGQGLVDGTVAAARWLLTRPDAVILVDGYNVSMLAWPDLSVADQRLALERAAAVVQQRTGAQFVVFFDGDSGAPAVRGAAGSSIRVRYTDSETEADDAILESVGRATVPVVVVVSNDRRVLDGAMALGANVIRSTELVSILRES